MAGKSFLRKTNRKQAISIATESVTRGAGTVAAAYFGNNILPQAKFIKPELRGPALLLLGLAGEIFVGNETLRAGFQGMSSYGFLRSTGDVVLREKKTQLGLSGFLGDMADENPQQIAGGGFDWNRALNEAPVSGMDDIGSADDYDYAGAGVSGGLEDESISGVMDRLL